MPIHVAPEPVLRGLLADGYFLCGTKVRIRLGRLNDWCLWANSRCALAVRQCLWVDRAYPSISSAV